MKKNFLFLFLLLGSTTLFSQSAWDLPHFYWSNPDAKLAEYDPQTRRTAFLNIPISVKLILDPSWNGMLIIKGGPTYEFQLDKVEVSKLSKPGWVEYKCSTNEETLIFFRTFHGTVKEVSYFYQPNDLKQLLFIKN